MPLLTSTELAAELKLSRLHVQRLADQGKLPVIWVGQSRRFDLQEVLKFCRTHPLVPPVSVQARADFQQLRRRPSKRRMVSVGRQAAADA